jgi:type III restriction enzyme
MRLRFKVQRYQTEAVDAVAGCFAGQPRHDPAGDTEPRNAEIALSPAQLLENIRAVQHARGLPLSSGLAGSPAADGPDTPNLDVEMETGTGKTYVYIKTIMELHRRYGWSKFIVVVPSIAIREGVARSFDITAAHFQQAYGRTPHAFCYSSSRLHEIERFASDAGVQVMIINIQAFNAAGADSRRIYDVLDAFQSRRPIDVIRATRPVVIIDEPQKIGAAKSLAALSRLHPLMVLRYSATHRVEHNKVHRLDAVDAYRQQLVKRIAVRGITVRGLAGTAAYLYLDGVETAAGRGPRARVELEVRTASGISRQVKRLAAGAGLQQAAGGLEAYRGLFITGIDAGREVIELSDGAVLGAGQATADVTEQARRRIQVREVIRAHLDKERVLFPLGIKVLSLFFVDEVARYRDYGRADTRGEYARLFEREYTEQAGQLLRQLPADAAAAGDASAAAEDAAYRRYLEAIDAESTHRGYFSVDRKTGRDIDGEVRRTGDEKGQSADADAYHLILRDKERLLSLEEEVRFIFSHSALREGWDNPNVFVIGMLKKSDSTVSRRQEIGRGLRLCVNTRGERMDDPLTVHEINELTVVTDESYAAFVDGLQREIGAPPGARPGGDATESRYPRPADGRRHRRPRGSSGAGPPGRRAGGAGDRALDLVELDSAELIGRCVRALDDRLQVDTLEYLLQQGGQRPAGDGPAASRPAGSAAGPGTPDACTAGFTAAGSSTRTAAAPASRVRYDLLGELAAGTGLTRRTVASILRRVSPATFARFRRSPGQFISEAARLINEQKYEVMRYRPEED